MLRGPALESLCDLTVASARAGAAMAAAS